MLEVAKQAFKVNDEKLWSEDKTRSANDGTCCSVSRTVQNMCVKRLLNHRPRRCSLNQAGVANLPGSLSPWERQGRASCRLRHIRFPNTDPWPRVSTGSDRHSCAHTQQWATCVYSLCVSGGAVHADPPPFSPVSTSWSLTLISSVWSGEILLFQNSLHLSKGF